MGGFSEVGRNEGSQLLYLLPSRVSLKTQGGFQSLLRLHIVLGGQGNRVGLSFLIRIGGVLLTVVS